MPQTISILGLEVSPIICLQVSAPAALTKALTVPGQTAVHSFHITLARLDDLGLAIPPGVRLPAPPATVVLKDAVRMITTADKQACYVEVDDDGQRMLREYVAGCGKILGVSLGEAHRVFHVTLSNAGAGAVRASVGSVWDYPASTL